MNKLFVILGYDSDGCTYSCNDRLDSIWSNEELALKRLYFLEKYHKTDNFSNFGFEIKEIEVDQISNHFMEINREKEWLKL